MLENAEHVEANLIGSMMYQNFDKIKEVSNRVSAQDFTNARNKIIYTKLVSMADKFNKIDEITLFEEVSKVEQFSNDVTRKFINQIHSGGKPDMIEQYISIIQEYARKIRLRELLNNEWTGLKKGTLSSEDAISRISQVVNEIKNESITTLTSTSLFEEVLSEIEEIRKIQEGEMKIPRVLSGFRKIDTLTGGGFILGSMIVIAGRPGSGKSSLALQLGLNSAKTDNKCLFITLEMTRSQLARRCLYSMAKVTDEDVVNCNLSDKDWDRMQFAVDELSRMKDSIFLESRARTTRMIVSSIHSHIRQHGVNVIILDFVQNVEISANSANYFEEVGNFVKILAEIARETNTIIYVISQLNRSVDTRKDQRPMLSDLSESRRLEEAASVVGLIYREEYYNPETEKQGIAEINIAKNRFGSTGTVELRFDSRFTSFI